MVPVKQNLVPSWKYGVKCPFLRTPSFVVIHNTANDAPASNEVSYMIGNDYEVSYHYAVDDKEIVQGIPENRNAWASGDGQGDGNMYGIHIEICYSLSGGSRFTQAEKNAAEFTANLLKKYGWGINKVKKHQDFDGKYCPHRTLDLGWQRFKDMVAGYLNKEEEDDMTAEEVRLIVKEEINEFLDDAAEKGIPAWAKAAVEWAVYNGILKGDANGDMRPESYVKRDEAAQMFYNFSGEGKEPSEYAKEIWEKAKEMGITDGSNPKAAMTREQGMVFFDRLGLLK
jgi:N-acetylmuramoyl-L-alanine amidase